MKTGTQKLTLLFLASLVSIQVQAAAPTASASASPTPVASPTASPSPVVNGKTSAVFEEFGGLPGLTRLVDDFTAKLIADARMSRFFVKIDQSRFKSKLVEQFCDVLGGPCTYTGQSMADSHDGLDIRHSHFNALVEVLRASMNDQKIPTRAQNKLLAKLAPMNKDIIGK